jgi:hypothetical protein
MDIAFNAIAVFAIAALERAASPRTRAVIVALAALTLHAGPARAVTWLCSLGNDGTVLVCVADVDAAEPGGEGPRTATAVTAVVNGTTFPLDPARLYTVPLWTPPTEADFVQLLARATMCYRSPDCAVVLAPSAWLGDAMVRSPAPQAKKTRAKAAPS